MAYLVHDPKPITMIRDRFSDLDDRIKALEDKKTALSSWKNPVHRAYKSNRRKRR